MSAYRVDIAAVSFFVVDWLIYGITLEPRLVRQPMAIAADDGARRDRDVAAAVRVQRLAGDGELGSVLDKIQGVRYL